MPESDIVIKGAREHNLQSVDLVMPRNQLICLTGVSGSGKSSLAFDTLYAEGQRRYVQSLSSFARHFMGQMPKPEVDFISGLSPSISISQKSAGTNPRSTVGTITEVYDFLRVLYARVGDGQCHQCGRPITAQTREQIIATIQQLEPGTRVVLLAPLIRGQKGEYRDLQADLLKQGFARARVDGRLVHLSDDLGLDRQMRHNIEVVIDRLEVQPQIRSRLAEAVELALKVGEGSCIVAPDTSEAAADRVAEPVAAPVSRGRSRRDGTTRQQSSAATSQDLLLSVAYACTHCQISFDPPSPQLFSFNSPQGMCPDCDGLGEQFTFAPELLVPDPRLSFRLGCFPLLGSLRSMGRWKRHIYQGLAETIERRQELPAGTLLNTPWKDLDPSLQHVWLWGTGKQHVTYTWRAGSSPVKHGGLYAGIIPELVSTYQATRSPIQLAQLEKYMRRLHCTTCQGERLKPQARAVTVSTAHPRFADQPLRTLPAICQMPVGEVTDFFSDLTLDATRTLIAQEVLKEIRGRLQFLRNVGLDYLSLSRTAPTLSGGESQRIRLASQLGCGLAGVLYILDEPSIGLHPRDNDQLLSTLVQLRDLGNTVVVVEHDEDTMRAADQIIDFGPGPGVRGGRVVAQGSLDDVANSRESVTGQFLAGTRRIDVPSQRRPSSDKQLVIRGATHHNLRQVDATIPLGAFVCVTGVSGSGKSSLVNDILAEALQRDLNQGNGEPGHFDSLEGLEHLDKMIAIDQSPIGRTPRSNPATYIKVFDDIRKLFQQLPEARRRGFKPGRFSFNVEGGRCEACSGNGSTRLEMDFLADVWVTCPVCGGHRFNRETLNVRFKDKSIADVLELDVQQALELFENIPAVAHKLQTLHDVGLDYIKLGQPSPTLSGGEAQRIKLARELAKRSTGRTLYLLDEPTTGLHFADIQLLLKVLHAFVDAGNTVLVVEHNLDVIKTADWIIDLGPEGGAGGGRIVAAGTPEQVAQVEESHTGRALSPVLKPRTPAKSPTKSRAAKGRKSQAATPHQARFLEVHGAAQHNLKHVDARIERDRMTVLCGHSGSGKSSLAMDTIYAEGQRRYVESLSAYARQFVSQMQKPRFDKIEGLSPAIAIEQQNLGHNPRSTVGTVTEIYDYFRILFARLGTPHCPGCGVPVGTQTSDEIVDKIMAEPDGTMVFLMAPLQVEVGQQYEALWEDLKARGFVRVRVDGETFELDNVPAIDRRRRHQVELVMDRLTIRASSRSRIAEAIEAALDFGQGVLHVAYPQRDRPESVWPVATHSQHLACGRCGRSFEPLTPHHFSFNTPLGWCPHCEGLGLQHGANPAALMRSQKMSLAEGALLVWPSVDLEISQAMLQSLSRNTGIPLDQPIDQLDARCRRLLLHGTGEQWFDVERSTSGSTAVAKVPQRFRFQFKGLYPALEAASRLNAAFRARLLDLVDEIECSACGGSRLREDAGAFKFREMTIDQLVRMPLGQLQVTLKKWRLDARERKIAGELWREITSRIQFLTDVGLEYLSLSRPAASLSGGEAQRIRLASQLGSGLCGVLYVLDEPTIGLHPRDNHRLLQALLKLRDLGNTLLVVEHDREVIAGSDAILDFGPGAGKFGGEIVAAGTPAEIAKSQSSVTGPYLSGKKGVPIPTNRRPCGGATPALPADSTTTSAAQKPSRGGAAAKTAKAVTKTSRKKKDAGLPVPVVDAHGPPRHWLEIHGARHHNLRNVTVGIPLGTLTAVTGVSGSGKSTLINDVLNAALARRLYRAQVVPGGHEKIVGVEHINKVIRVDQQPLGNSPSSNPATYTGAFDLIRELFSQLPAAKVRGFTARRFSFNVAGGRCEACEGNGQRCIEMHFLPDVWVPCDTCGGKRYNPETLEITYHGRSIADVLEMTCGDALQLMGRIPKIRRILQTLCDVGLDYLALGQPAPTLSGGEAQRVKLAAELARPDTGRTLYLLDEPTTGLHFDDLRKLLEVLHRLVDMGNTVVVIEHNLDVIKTADWIIDMGPEAGADGGRVVAVGTPEDLVASASTPGPHHTASALRPVLEQGPYQERAAFDPHATVVEKETDMKLADVGGDARMPWELDGRRWHTQDRIGRDGKPCRWDGRVLAAVVDRIHELGTFSETNWNSRSVVEITGTQRVDGWFFHALTGENWLLKLKFRVAKHAFKRDKLEQDLNLKSLNELDDLPVYGNDSRVKFQTLRGAWHEIQVHLHSWEEVDTPPFWNFVEHAVHSYQRMTQRAAESPDEVSPWKKLGKKWHFSRRGFPPGQSVAWPMECLEQLCGWLQDVAPEGQFLWNNQQVVHLFVKPQRDPWATIYTKRPGDLDLVLSGPKSSASLGRVAELAREPRVDTSHQQRDVVKLKFRDVDDLERGDLKQFLQEHLGRIYSQNNDHA